MVFFFFFPHLSLRGKAEKTDNAAVQVEGTELVGGVAFCAVVKYRAWGGRKR